MLTVVVLILGVFIKLATLLHSGTPGAEKLLLPDDVHTISEEHELVNINARTLRSRILTELRMDTQDVCSSLDGDLTAATAIALDDMQAVTWDRVREATTSDPIMFELCQIIEDKSSIPMHQCLKLEWTYSQKLHLPYL